VPRLDEAMTAPVPREELEPPDEQIDLEVELLLQAIHSRYLYEFRNYARASLRRRVLSALTHFRVSSVSMLQDLILRERAAFTELLGFLTVPVSEMFRDPLYFRILREEVAPVLATYASLKVWVAGCSTGEEAYSIAIVLDELGLLDRSVIYATDINPTSLRTAETGVYQVARVASFSRNYHLAGGTRSLADYYTAAYDGVVLDRRLRAAITFADHSLATDEVFSEVQLVSCRNVLIYFDRRLQDRALGLFRSALVPLGFLGLGMRETVQFSGHNDAFELLHREARFFRKTS
jgi:chemotaxis protein methyltransferase CheR